MLDQGGLQYRSGAGRWVIAATVLGSGMSSVDATVVGIALPTIGREFHASVAQLQWVVSGYTLTLAALLLVGGSLGDRFGRRRIFTIGVIWFTVASAACAVAPGATTLIALRMLQGVGGALLTPGSLAILQASFRQEDRGQAIGAWTGLGGVASATGPFIGGWLIAVASWRWIFFINLPIGLVVLLLSVRHVPESRDGSAPERVDVPGALLVMIALAGVTYGLIEGPAHGWRGPGPAGALVVGVAAAGLFVLVESRSSAPLLPLGLFRHRQFTVTNAVTFVVYGALGGVLFLLPVVLQVVGGYSPLASGVALLPLTVMMLLLSSTSGRLATRIGPRLQMSVGPVVVGCGLALLSRVTMDSAYLTGVLPAVLVFGLGLAVTVAPLTATALAAVPVENAGLASAVNNDVARVGGLVAVAVLPALSGITGSVYLHPAQLADGFRMATLIAGTWCVAGGVLAAVGIRNPEQRRDGLTVPDGVPAHEYLDCGLDAPPQHPRPPPELRTGTPS
jgi:EmrB/QacA subfamily drug resistance transporter